MSLFEGSSAAIAFGCISFGAHASTIFTFNEFSNGQIIDQIDDGFGLNATVSGIRFLKNGSQAADIVACDTNGTPSDCDDPDLLAPFNGDEDDQAGDGPLGIVAIVQEDPAGAEDVYDPADDNARGGIITFEFNKMIKLLSVDVVDVEGNSLTITLDGVTLNPTGDGTNGVQGNNEYELFEVANNDVMGTLLVFNVGTSFAIDNLEVQAIPLPAGLTLMLAGLGTLGFAARRRKTG